MPDNMAHFKNVQGGTPRREIFSVTIDDFKSIQQVIRLSAISYRSSVQPLYLER